MTFNRDIAPIIFHSCSTCHRPGEAAPFSLLTVDACVSPKGDLVVAVHSGAPDWGSGPGGKGKLYKISWTGKTLPQPVAAWPAGPREVRIAFDR